MATIVQWAKCWLLLSILRIINTAGDIAEIRRELEFGGLAPGENSIEIEENNYINLTAYLSDQNVFKISYQLNNLTVDLCKFVRSTTCGASDSSYCRCLNNHTVQFLKKATRSDSGLYTWKWRHGKTPDKQRDIFIKVKQATQHTGNRSDDTASAATTATIVCVILIVVVTAMVGVVFWMRNKTTCSIGWPRMGYIKDTRRGD